MAKAAKLYQEDFYLWTRSQAEALRRLAAERWNGPLDLEHLAEEVEELGTSQLSTVRSQLERVIEHLLNARGHAADRMTAAIRNEIEPAMPRLYARARRRAVISFTEHGELDLAAVLPKTCPYTLDRLLDEDWFPANQHGLTDPVT